MGLKTGEVEKSLQIWDVSVKEEDLQVILGTDCPELNPTDVETLQKILDEAKNAFWHATNKKEKTAAKDVVDAYKLLFENRHNPSYTKRSEALKRFFICVLEFLEIFLSLGLVLLNREFRANFKSNLHSDDIEKFIGSLELWAEKRTVEQREEMETHISRIKKLFCDKISGKEEIPVPIELTSNEKLSEKIPFVETINEINENSTSLDPRNEGTSLGNINKEEDTPNPKKQNEKFSIKEIISGAKDGAGKILSGANDGFKKLKSRLLGKKQSGRSEKH